MVMKITLEQFEEFEKDFLFKKLSDPTYRFGQHFLNYFTDIGKDISSRGPEGIADTMVIWHMDSLDELKQRAGEYLP
jgi:hypothetical protein